MTDSSPYDGIDPTIDCIADADTSAAISRAADVSRAAVGFVEGTKPRLADETATLLRQRLKAVSLILSITLVVAFVGNFFLPQVSLIVLRAVVLVLVICCYFLLRSEYPLSPKALRVVELVVFGGVAVQVTLNLTVRTLGFAEDGNVASAIAGKNATFLVWSVLILLYGMFMPNTWRQAAIALFPAAGMPYGIVLFMRWHSKEAADIFDKDHFGMPVPVPLLAAFAAVYASHIIHSIRREAFKARQFGQYRLKEKLGAGGMGEVYEAEHVLLKRPCAIKLIKPGTDTNEMVLARFEREVRSTAKLTHWNTVEIYDYGHTDDATFYYVMELLPGMSLEELVRRYGPLPPERVIHLMRQTCSALREAHGNGLIHRDIKPANIFAAKRGGICDVAKLLDFGLVKHRAGGEAQDSDLTQAGTISGSPLYMSPEQATAFSDTDVRTDIYSLGAVAYYLLVGKPPFEGRNAIEIIIAHSRDSVTPPSELQQGVPSDLETVILTCLAKDVNDRYADVATLDAALAACACAGRWDDESAAAWWQERETKSRHQF